MEGALVTEGTRDESKWVLFKSAVVKYVIHTHEYLRKVVKVLWSLRNHRQKGEVTSGNYTPPLEMWLQFVLFQARPPATSAGSPGSILGLASALPHFGAILGTPGGGGGREPGSALCDSGR